MYDRQPRTGNGGREGNGEDVGPPVRTKEGLAGCDFATRSEWPRRKSCKGFWDKRKPRLRFLRIHASSRFEVGQVT